MTDDNTPITDIAGGEMSVNGNALRTRIAAVLYEDGQRPMNTAVRLADAVIRELGLTIQVAGPDGIAYGKHRYITDWITDD